MNRKFHFSTTAVVICLIALLFAFTPKQSDAGEYIGDFCWAFTNSTFKTSGTLQLGISHLGGAHYTCSGVITVTDPISLQFPAYGNIELLGGKIYITLSFAGTRDGVIGIDMTKAVLNPDLSGKFDSIGVYADAVEISEGTFTSVGCE